MDMLKIIEGLRLKVTGDLKVPRPCMAQGVRHQKGASPIEARCQF